jgi:dephospho-CoA kinase
MKTSPFELGTCNWSNDDVFDEVVRLMNERTTRGDVPLNLNATGQMTHAFMYSADPLLKKWVLEYLEVWAARADDNGGIMPDNVGLSGVVGEYLEGKWWGGHYGWRWPHGLFTIMEPLVNACSNAYLLTGDPSWLDPARKQLDENFALGHQDGDQYLTPNKHFDAGWTDYRPDPSGNLDRDALGKLVFSDEVARADLNAIIHPRVRTLYHEKIAELGASNPTAIVVYAVPLLAEARAQRGFDAVVVVDAPADTREERLREYRGLTASDARSRVLAQATDEERRALADSIIDASVDLETTERAAHELYDELESLWPDRLSQLSKRFPRGVS